MLKVKSDLIFLMGIIPSSLSFAVEVSFSTSRLNNNESQLISLVLNECEKSITALLNRR